MYGKAVGKGVGGELRQAVGSRVDTSRATGQPYLWMGMGRGELWLPLPTLKWNAAGNTLRRCVSLSTRCSRYSRPRVGRSVMAVFDKSLQQFPLIVQVHCRLV